MKFVITCYDLVANHEVTADSCKDVAEAMNKMRETHLLRHIHSAGDGRGLVCVWIEKASLGENGSLPLGFQVV